MTKHAPTKDQELALLDELIAKLGPRSYIGPWLTYSRPEIERDIRSDMGISAMLPAAAITWALDHMTAAKTDAAAYRASVELAAAQYDKATRAKTDAHAAAVRRHIIAALHAADAAI